MNLLMYKYLPFSEGSLKVLTEGTIKFTKPSDFNDPFDCSPDYDSNNIEKFFESRPDLLDRVAVVINLSPSQLTRDKPAMINRLREAFMSGQFGQPFSDRVGICSLTRDPLNLLMWSHYAQNHTGFVVEFSIQPDFPLNNGENSLQFVEWLIPHKVHYQAAKPIVSLFDDVAIKINKQFLTKAQAWEYEQEERVIDYVRGDGIHKYNRKRILGSVVAGMKMKDTDYRALNTVVTKINKDEGLDIGLCRVIPAVGKFDLIVPDRPDLLPLS